jgi:hypothetical protein
LRVLVYRKRVHYHSTKNYQLDPFFPYDGYFEDTAVSNLTPTRAPSGLRRWAHRKRPSRT